MIKDLMGLVKIFQKYFSEMRNVSQIAHL